MAELGQAVTAGGPGDDAADAGAESRPLVERLGLGAIAVVFAGIFSFVAFAAFTSGELFLAVMAAIGALMTIWAAASTLRRG